MKPIDQKTHPQHRDPNLHSLPKQPVQEKLHKAICVDFDRDDDVVIFGAQDVAAVGNQHAGREAARGFDVGGETLGPNKTRVDRHPDRKRVVQETLLLAVAFGEIEVMPETSRRKRAPGA